MNIVEALDGLGDYQKCASGLAECNDEQPCGMHDTWKALRSRIIEYLEQTSIADLATGAGARSAARWPNRAAARPRSREEEVAGPCEWPARRQRWAIPSWSPWWSSRPRGASAPTTSTRGC